MSKLSKLHVILADIHYPEHDDAAFRAVLTFLKKNRKQIASVTLLGDAMDCGNISRHAEGKPRLKKRGGWKEDLDGFAEDILDRIDECLSPGTKKVYLSGNHEQWIQDLLDKQPELEGLLEIPELLKLKEKGWEWKDVGGHIERAGFILLHGDQIGSGIHVAKKAGDLVNGNVIMGHVHRLSMFSRAALVTETKKHLAATLPCLCTIAPKYAKGQPNAFVVGFGVLEEFAINRANLYTPVVMGGVFSYGGVIYGK